MAVITGSGSFEHAVASVALAASLCLGPDPPARGQSATERAQLDRLRAGLQKYQDPVVAIHDGYFSTLGCIVIDKSGGPGQVPYEPGGMGVEGSRDLWPGC